ncbi:MAG: hypothetical protein QNJ74_23225 [Trichodesmium sp. MO_231.B1]|nr:hypothetical protein [Trichodesmium sp. MO_231.B1]
MTNQAIAITTTAKKHEQTNLNSSFEELTDMELETLVWEKKALTKQTKPGQLGEEESESFFSFEKSEVEQFPRQTNSLQRQRTIILEELDELSAEVERFLSEEESSLDEESESLSSHEQLELKELVEELEVSVQELDNLF